MNREQKWKCLYDKDGVLQYEGFTLENRPYGIGTAFFSNGHIYQEGIFGEKGLVNGREYFPDGTIRFEGTYRVHRAYGPNYPVFGKCYDREGNVYYDGKLILTFGGVGYPMVAVPEEFGPVLQEERPNLMLYPVKADDDINAFLLWENNIYLNNRAFNITLGREPLNRNVFDYLVVELLRNADDAYDDYLSIAYNPVREDGITCIQSTRMGDLYDIEIVKAAMTETSYRLFRKKNLPLETVIGYFWSVCGEFETVDLSDWVEVPPEEIE